MHTFGNPAELEALAAVCRRFGLVMIEDAAEALGSTYRGRHAGNHGLMSALSFNGNKVVTTGGGGALVTSDPELCPHSPHPSPPPPPGLPRPLLPHEGRPHHSPP